MGSCIAPSQCLTRSDCGKLQAWMGHGGGVEEVSSYIMSPPPLPNLFFIMADRPGWAHGCVFHWFRRGDCDK